MASHVQQENNAVPVRDKEGTLQTRDERMAARLESERREAEARDQGDGVVSEFVAWIPMAIGVVILMLLLWMGMLALEPTPFDLFG